MSSPFRSMPTIWMIASESHGLWKRDLYIGRLMSESKRPNLGA
jgi:hypothetical protein